MLLICVKYFRVILLFLKNCKHFLIFRYFFFYFVVSFHIFSFLNLGLYYPNFRGPAILLPMKMIFLFLFSSFFFLFSFFYFHYFFQYLEILHYFQCIHCYHCFYHLYYLYHFYLFHFLHFYSNLNYYFY